MLGKLHLKYNRLQITSYPVKIVICNLTILITSSCHIWLLFFNKCCKLGNIVLKNKCKPGSENLIVILISSNERRFCLMTWPPALLTAMHIDLIGRQESVQIQKREQIKNNAQNVSAFCQMNAACLDVETAPCKPSYPWWWLKLVPIAGNIPEDYIVNIVLYLLIHW